MKDFVKIQEELAQPFAPQDLEWRVQYVVKDRMQGLVVPYVTCRAIQDRLDTVVGAENWRNEFQPWQGGKNGAQICGISIFVEERKEWLTKWDGAENTDIEAVKGGLSDSMKRAAVQWGIGRVLYKMPTFWAGVQPRGKSYYIPDSERPKLDSAYLDALGRMNLIPAAPGGLQSQLGGTAGYSDEQPEMAQTGGNPTGQYRAPAGRNGQNRAPAGRNNAGQGGNPAGQGAAMPGGGNPALTFTIVSFKVQQGMNRQTTSFHLRDNSTGEVIKVFFNGVDQRLVADTVLGNVRISQKVQGNVQYLVLEKYEILPQMPSAA
ncbi:MAG: hypothetical protein IJT94_11795 [Oscillibacter sp.]|nr:hypothetical protein [Oscillibacter sp.]